MDFPERLIFDGMNIPPFRPLKENVEKRFTEIRDLECRKDDIILATYNKSGTHWIWEVVCMLIKGNTEYTKEIKEFFFLEAIPDLDVVHNLPSPRPMNTHLPYRWLPKQLTEKGGKIIHVIRNPKDVAVSLYHHLVDFGLSNISFSQFMETMFMIPSPAFSMGSWYDYVKEFEQAAENDKHGAILTTFYESMKKNPIDETKRLAKFLNVEASDKLIEDIVEKCSFGNLKNADKTIKDQSILKKIIDLPSVDGQAKPNIYRKGIIGDWKNHFTVALNEQFDKIYAEEMKNSKLPIQFE
ncbi:sulfotransferase 1E1-like [Crassostrea angulata]|uniref:sulfotransferase 1E1-like n=1 Tax=Magallana angulata TaxID=2784310 RepID=UPI0022B0E452|nr:sulfotransferase 1E1-like [Crassostrea angulata]